MALWLARAGKLGEREEFALDKGELSAEISHYSFSGIKRHPTDPSGGGFDMRRVRGGAEGQHLDESSRSHSPYGDQDHHSGGAGKTGEPGGQAL